MKETLVIAPQARDPQREVLGLSAQILVKDCNFDVNTPHFVGAECVVCKRVIGLSALSFECNVDLPIIEDHGIV